MELPDSAMQEAAELRDIYGAGNFFLELQDHGLPAQPRVNAGLLEISRKLGIPCVCTNDSHYLRKEDARAHELLLCIQTGKTFNDPNRMRWNAPDGCCSGNMRKNWRTCNPPRGCGARLKNWARRSSSSANS